MQVIDYRRQVVADATWQIEAIADILAAQIERPAKDEKPGARRTSDAIVRALPAWVGSGRRILLANADGMIIAAVPREPNLKAGAFSTSLDRRNR